VQRIKRCYFALCAFFALVSNTLVAPDVIGVISGMVANVVVKSMDVECRRDGRRLSIVDGVATSKRFLQRVTRHGIKKKKKKKKKKLNYHGSDLVAVKIAHQRISLIY